jgi:hypothetical protein
MSNNASFEKIAECLYRNPSSGTYYALVKVRGKQHKQSLKTVELAEAKRKLRDFRTELEQTTPKSGKPTIREICLKYLLTMRDQSASTQQNKEIMLAKVEAKFGGISDLLNASQTEPIILFASAFAISLTRSFLGRR